MIPVLEKTAVSRGKIVLGAVLFLAAWNEQLRQAQILKDQQFDAHSPPSIPKSSLHP